MENIEVTPDVVESPVEASTPSSASRPVPALEEVELKIDGKIVKVTKEKALLMAQKAAAADKRFQEAAEAKQQAEELLGAAKQREFLKLAEKAGMSKAEAKEALEQTLLKLYEEDAMSPEERELRELRQLKAQQEAEAEARKRAEEQERLTKEEQKFLEKLESDLVDALEKSVLPPSPIMAKFAANYMSAAMANGIDLSPAEAVKLVEQDQITMAKQLVNGLPVSKLEEILGPKVVKAIRDAGVEAIKKNESKLKPSPAAAAPKPAPKPEGPKKAASFFDQLRRQNGLV